MPRALRTGREDAVRVIGLAEFIRDIRALSGDLSDLRRVHLDAAQLVANDAERRARALGGVAAKTAPTIRAAAEQRHAKVALGGARAPFGLGAEFGAKRFAQFKDWRGNQWQPDVNNGVGYFLHPAVRATRERFVEIYADALHQLSRRAFPD